MHSKLIPMAVRGLGRSSRFPLLILAGLFLAGFDREKTQAVTEHCISRGNGEAACRCAVRLQEEALGPKFTEAIYYQTIGDMTSYEMKLYEVMAENPHATPDALTALEAHIKESCGPLR